MDAWIELARGPLFRIALTVMVLGLGYRVVVTVAQIASAWYRAGDRRLPLSDITEATVKWLSPSQAKLAPASHDLPPASMGTSTSLEKQERIILAQRKQGRPSGSRPSRGRSCCSQSGS